MKYALLIYSPSTAEEYAVMATAARNTRDRDGEWVRYTQAAKDAGVLVAAEQLTHTETATSVRVRAAGERLITDGPFMEMSAANFTAGYRPAMAVSAGISLLGAVAAIAVGRKRPVPAAAPASVPVSAAKPRGAGDVPAAMNSGVVAP